MKRRDRSSPFGLFSFQDIVTGLCGIVILLVLVMIFDLVARRDAAPAPVLPESAVSEADLVREIAFLEEKLAHLRAELASRRVALSEGVSAERFDEATRELSAKEREIAALLSQAEALRTRLERARDADAESRRVLEEMERTRRELESGLAALRDRRGVTLIPERGNLKSPVYIVLGRGRVEIHRPLDKGAQPVRAPQHDTADAVRNALRELSPATHTVVLLVRASGASDMDGVAALVKKLGFACGRDPLEEDAEIAFGPAAGGGA